MIHESINGIYRAFVFRTKSQRWIKVVMNRINRSGK